MDEKLDDPHNFSILRKIGDPHDYSILQKN